MHRGAINVSVCPRWRQRSAADIVSHNFSSEFNTDVLHHVILRCGATGLDVCRSVRAVLAGEVSRRYTLWIMLIMRRIVESPELVVHDRSTRGSFGDAGNRHRASWSRGEAD
jgi:hypothetical protein